jgi:cytochrome P450
LPSVAAALGRFDGERPAPLANKYVLETSKKEGALESSLLHKLQNSKPFSQIAIAAECMDHLVAGIDTTGDELCFLMYQLSLPESWSVQDKLFQELNKNEGRSLDELPYLDAVLKEGLRCFPPIPMSQPRYVPEGGRTIDGHFIPAGTIVSAQAWSVHRLNEETYRDGNQFLPERWLDNSKSLDMNRLFFAFGLGARGCTGRQ